PSSFVVFPFPTRRSSDLIFFNEDIVDAEGLFSFALSAPELIRHLLFAPDYPHTSAAASGCRLQHYRVAAFLGKPESHFFRWDGLDRKSTRLNSSHVSTSY